MAELLPCPFCGSSSVGLVDKKDPQGRPTYTIICVHCGASINNYSTPQYAKKKWNTRTPKERGADKPKVTCLNCKHLMFSDMYGECNKQLRIVKPSDTCEFAEPKERGGEK